MKGSKTKFVQQKVLSDYELKRIERIKHNADFMEAKGYSSLADKIFQKQLQFANVGVEKLNDEDEVNTIEEESDDTMDEASNNVGSKADGSKVINKKTEPLISEMKSRGISSTKIRTMADYVTRNS